MMKKILIFDYILVILNILLIFGRGDILSASMEPTLKTGQYVIYNRLNEKEYNRGDIVIFNFYENDSEALVIKRIIGIEGDKVSFKDGKVFINDEMLVEDYLPAGTVTESDIEEFNVPSGCVFVLGDNRENSYDSRYFNQTYVRTDNIIGRVLFY